MKLFVLALFILLFSASLFSQTWIQKGAIWHYAYDALSSTGFTKFVYEKDTSIGGKTCQKITSNLYEFGADQNQQTFMKGIFPQANQYTFVSGDTVFYWFENQFYVLCNFKAKPNDTWTLGNNASNNKYGCTSASIKVDSVGVVAINGDLFRWVAVSPAANSNMRLKGKIVERFGAMEFNLFPTQNVCDNSAADLPQSYFTCFEDDSFALLNKSGKDCEYLMKINVFKTNFNDTKISIYPNPAKGLITIDQVGFEYNALEIYSVDGRQINNFNLNQSIEIIDVSNLPKGIYTIKFISSQGQFNFKKMLVD